MMQSGEHLSQRSDSVGLSSRNETHFETTSVVFIFGLSLAVSRCGVGMLQYALSLGDSLTQLRDESGQHLRFSRFVRHGTSPYLGQI